MTSLRVRFANVCGDLCVTFEVSQCSNPHTNTKQTNHKTVVQTHTSKPEQTVIIYTQISSKKLPVHTDVSLMQIFNCVSFFLANR